MKMLVYKLTFDSAKSRWRYLSSMAWVLFSRWQETFSNSSSTVHKRTKRVHEDCDIEEKVLNSISAAPEAIEFVTSLIVLRRVGSSLVEMVRQQSVQCVLKRVERSTVVWVKH